MAYLIVLITDTLNECISRLKAWKADMERKVHRVNMKKTKWLVSAVDLDVLKKLGKYPCAVCRSGVATTISSTLSVSCGQIHPMLNVEEFLAATKQLYEWFSLSVCLSVCLSVTSV